MGAIAILGATGGLGSAITERIAQRAPVIIGYHRNAEKAQAACAAIARSGGRNRSAPMSASAFRTCRTSS